MSAPPAPGGLGVMIVDRSAPVNRFAVVPRRLADFEPEPRELDRLLADDERRQRVPVDRRRRRYRGMRRGRLAWPTWSATMGCGRRSAQLPAGARACTLCRG